MITRLGRFGPIEDRMIRDYPEYRLYNVRGPRDANLVGAGCGFAHINVGADWTCADERHWIFAGTEMRNGDGIPGLVGWETQGGLGDLVRLSGGAWTRGDDHKVKEPTRRRYTRARKTTSSSTPRYMVGRRLSALRATRAPRPGERVSGLIHASSGSTETC